MADISASAHVTPSNKLDKRAMRVRSEADAPPTLVSLASIVALTEIAQTAPEGGCFVEVGVYKGGTAFHLANVAREQGRRIFLFDTFEGIPYTNKEKGDRHKVGDFDDAVMADVVAAIPDAIVVKGVFPDSMDIINLPKVAFVHIDADQYDSIVNSMDALAPYMMSGAIAVFDDYDCLEGATQAVIDLYGEDGFTLTETGKAMVRYQ